MSILFFFQAEDGIRDLYDWSSDVCSSDLVVEPLGIDTQRGGRSSGAAADRSRAFAHLVQIAREPVHLRLEVLEHGGREVAGLRSEERRVGKEWRARWATAGCERSSRRGTV